MQTALYPKEIAACEAALERLRKEYNRLSLLRAGAALAALVFFLAGLEWNGWVGFPLCAAAVAGFIVLMRLHDRVERRQRYQQARRAAAQAYLDRAGEGWKTFPETGREFLQEEFPAGRDLDIFGRESVYQYLCAAHTAFGKEQLARWLREGEQDPAVIRRRQKAVEELAGKTDFSLEVQAHGRMMTPARARQDAAAAADFADFLEAARRTDRLPAALTVLMWALPFLELFFLLSALVGAHPGLNGAAALAVLLFQLLLAMARFPATGRSLVPLARFKDSIAPYAELLALLERESFESDELRDLQNAVCREGGAVRALRSLHRLGETAGMRRNPMAFFLFNGLFLWDFHCVSGFSKWREQWREELPVWLEAIGQLEALLSLAVLPQVRRTVFPEIEEGAAPRLSFEGLTHPLIPEDRAVGNDFCMEHHTCVITGSNMSGKTTFLRSIGVALVLAYAGGAVPARAFRAGRMRLLTSMRTEGNVSRGISTFYAELLRIKTIVDAAREPEPLIALIDEIYKGTNSRDRILGATETIRRLAAPHVMVLVTTHDFELCDLEKDAAADAINYHFTERYAGGEILFDYTIRPGRCRTTNAQQLLRMVGILPDEPQT